MYRPKSIEELAIKELGKSGIARDWEREDKAGHETVVTISRGMGTGARIIAVKLAEDLQWDLWDKELLGIMAGNARVARQTVEKFDEKGRSEIDLFMQAVLGNHEPVGFLYGKHITQAVVEIAKDGNCVIIGRGANFALPNALNVRIDASYEYRIKNMMEFEGLSRSEAESAIRASDRQRHHFLVSTFGKERVESFQYDLHFSMDKFTNDDVAEIIKTTLKARRKPSRQNT